MTQPPSSEPAISSLLDEEESEVNTAEEIDLEIVHDNTTDEYHLQRIPVTVSFEQGLFYATNAIEMFQEKLQARRAVFIGIAGPTGSGKSTVAAKIKELFRCIIISMDIFIATDKVIDNNFDDPNVFDFNAARVLLPTLHLFNTDLHNLILALRQGISVSIPIISNDTKAPIGNQILSATPDTVVILDGAYAINETIRPLLDITMSITGGIHLDLLKRIMRDIKTLEGSRQKDTLLRIANVVFPMFKVYIEPEIRQAMIRIHNTYNPIPGLVHPIYVTKAKYQIVKESFDQLHLLLPNCPQTPLATKQISDMYLYPPRYDPDSVYKADRRYWIRIRRMDGLFYIHFYNETMDATVNVRPSINFEVSVQTISGLLSLGYQIGAVLNRTTETWYESEGVTVTKEYIKELEKQYVQIKGVNRKEVMRLSQLLHINENHIQLSFLYLYFRKLDKKKRKAAKAAVQSQPAIDKVQAKL